MSGDDSTFSPSAKRLASRATRKVTKMGRPAMSGDISAAEAGMFPG
jgi:hypothetical protein